MSPHPGTKHLVKAGVASRDLDAAVLVDLPPTERLPAHVHLVAGPVCVRMLKYVDRFEPGEVAGFTAAVAAMLIARDAAVAYLPDAGMRKTLRGLKDALRFA